MLMCDQSPLCSCNINHHEKHQFLKGNAAVQQNKLEHEKVTRNQKNWSLLDGMHLEYTYDSLWHMESIYYWNTTAQINQTSNS